ncbi:phenolic glucoside malonyltransferase 2-like [Argentina anserina]|uniref:phenolic glucoside malonyltransferase 2-like n=1 Tax=Argentina anserina TaxID=57926 RepID=UPI00217678DA|nr:phenolic glucoside malonyltransferase 2-like [Potentilla anserina]XP_050380898.1 phenolic glucoside malonyltransferase 2-like [Potentilla anserina]
MELPNSSVKVVQVCRVTRVAPASPLPDLSLPLTFFDIRWLRFAPVQLLYFYEISSSSSIDSTFSFDSILDKLKTSLSLTLKHFLPLAGNLTWPKDSPKPVLSYVQGDTLRLTIVESSNADFARLSSNYGLLEAQEYHPLVPQLEVSHERAAVMSLQITLFPNKGFSVGAAVHSAVFDGSTANLFFKSWAHICKHQGATSSSLPDQLKPFYDRAVIDDQKGLGTLFSIQYQGMDGPNNRSLMVWELQVPQDSVRATFEITRASIQSLRGHVMAAIGSDTSLHLSTFSLACAYTWVCLVRAEETKEDEARLVFSVDCRSRLDPPIPATYFGNCVVGCLVVAKTKGLLGEDGLVVALSAISETLRNLVKKGLLNEAESWVSRLSSLRSGRLVGIAGSHQFGMYEISFGWGSPSKVEFVSIDRTGAISMTDSKNGGGGVDVGLVLKKQYMDAFASLFVKGLIPHSKI